MGDARLTVEDYWAMPSMPPPPPVRDRMTFSVSGVDYDTLLAQARIILDAAAQGHRYTFDLDAEPGVMRTSSGHPSLWLGTVHAHVRRERAE